MNHECCNFFTVIEEWPIWRTRTPVVIALRHHHGRTEHHRYRYMVVTPGADQQTSIDEFKEGDDDETMVTDSSEHREGGLGATTSQNGSSIATHVMAWEDPFQDAQNVS